MIWLPDGLLSIPDRIRARRQSRQESETRRQNAQQSQAAQSAQKGGVA